MRLDAAAGRLSLDPRDAAFVQDPYAAYVRLHREAPAVFWEELGLACFARHADVQMVLRDRRFGRRLPPDDGHDASGRPAMPAHMSAVEAFERHSLLELEPPAHTRLRGLVQRAFMARGIEPLAPRIEAIAHECLDAIERGRDADLLEAYATPIPVRVISDMLGVPADMAPQLLAWSHDMVAIYQARRDETIERRADAAAIEFSSYVRALAAERRGTPREDLLSALTAAQSDGSRLSEDELVSTVILLLNAGHEATVHAIANAVKTLIENGTNAAARLAHPETAAALVEETLRFDPPLHLFTRRTLEDLELGGVRIAAGRSVAVLLAAANRDPAVFPDPGRFDPDRAPNPHVSFGAGIHFCLGAPLARMEISIALRVLFERCPDLALAAAPRYRDTWHFHGLEALRTRL